jgi:hypothetical protein
MIRHRSKLRQILDLTLFGAFVFAWCAILMLLLVAGVILIMRWAI